MASKVKRFGAIILGAMMTASAFAGCDTTTESSSSESSSDTSSSESSSETSAVDVLGDEYTEILKDKLAEEAASNSEDGYTISLVLWCSSDDGDFEKSVVEDFIEKYTDEDDRYTIDVTVKAVVGEDKAGTKLSEDASTAADVCSVADDQLNDLYSAGCIAEVASIFAANVEAENSEEAVEACSKDGTMLAFPKSSDNTYVLYYDKSVFDEDDVASFDALLEACQENNTSLFFPITNAWYNTSFFFTAGCTIDLTDDVQTATFASDEGVIAVQAMQHMLEWLDDGLIAEGDENSTIQTGFQDGTIKAAITGTWMSSAIAEAIGEENVGVVKLPTVYMDGEEQQMWNFGGYKVVVVNKQSDFPIASQCLAYYMTCADVQIARHTERGSIPTVTEALEDESVASDQAVEAVAEQIEYSLPQSDAGGTYWTPIGAIGTDLIADQRAGTIADEDTIMERLEEAVSAL